jgi:hypothetical protein
VLQSACVHTLVRQGVAGGMAQHMNVNREWQLGGLAGALDHAANTHAPERLAPFVDEHISRLGALALQALEASKLVPF